MPKEKKKTAMQRLQETLMPKKAEVEGKEVTRGANSQTPFAVSDLVANTAKPKLSSFSYEFDNKSLQDTILGNDYLSGADLIDEDGGISNEALNKVIQKAVYSAVQSAQSNTLEVLGKFDEHSLESMEKHISSFSEAQVLSATEFSKDEVTQSHAILYRDQLKRQYPDATPEALNDAVKEYIEVIESKQPEKTNDANLNKAEVVQETDWAKEFGVENAPNNQEQEQEGGSNHLED